MARVLPFICIDDIEEEFQENNGQAVGSTQDVQNTAEVIDLVQSTRSDQGNSSCASNKDCARESVSHDTSLDSEDNDVHKVAKITENRETDSSTNYLTDQAWTDEQVPRDNSFPGMRNSDHNDAPHDVTEGANTPLPADTENLQLAGSAADTVTPKENHHAKDTVLKIFRCKVCDKHFLSRAELRDHVQRIQNVLKPNMCIVCHKAFSDKCHLKVHMRSHTGEKPYKCDVCAKCFSQRGNLTRHMVIHTGRKPYACTFCERCFTRADHLKKHVLKRHFLERLNPCSSGGDKVTLDTNTHVPPEDTHISGSAGDTDMAHTETQKRKYKGKDRKCKKVKRKVVVNILQMYGLM